MAISVEDYFAAVRANLPEARVLVDKLAAEGRADEVWQLNGDLVHLLLWSWRTGDRDTCTRILGVMELGLVDTDDDYAPVWNSVGIGVVETIDRDLQRDDFAAFVETWPPALREQGLPYTTALREDEFYDEEPDTFRLPLGPRVRWALRHPISSRLGTRIRFTG
ncbi:MAG: hypothetical protein M3Q98_13300 [Actinomycetota bacterium]|nr:hypothetical protein [Actinomycetota bacterium]